MADLFRRWRWALLAAGLLALALAWAFWPDAVAVDTGKASRGAMAVGVTDDGVTRAEEFYVVSAPVTGYLSRIELKPGDAVARGAVIAVMRGRPATPLDSRSRQQLQAALAAARAAEAGAAAELGQARRDLARAQALSGEGIISRAQLEGARTRVSTGQSGLAQARAEAARVQAELGGGGGVASGGGVAVRAPAGGQVLSVATESEGVIAEGAPLVTIGDPARIEVVVDLLSREAVRVRPGDAVEITQWGGPTPIPGAVRRIEPYGRLKVSALGVEEQRVDVVIGFAAAAAAAGQAARLGHGYQVDATIVLWRGKDVLRVPIAALFRGGDGGWRAFVNQGGRARERRLRIGHINEEFGEVLEGLAAGEAVVLNPGNALADGARIRQR